MGWGGTGYRGWPIATGGSAICYVADGSSEGVSGTTSGTFVQKLLVSFTAVLGVRYHIHSYLELEAPDDEDVEGEVTINTVQYAFCHFKNYPYATRWSQMNGAFYQSNALSGNQDIRINWRNGFGAGTKNIRRARILVTQCP
ncbi:MAG: hypothetical protein GWN62_04360 [Aliifodinibius sp.]|nr:hypothetical protein [Fodinibius sp.]